MHQFIMKFLAVFFTGITLVACSSLQDENSYLHDQRMNYLKSRNNESLRFPPDLREANVSHDFDIPSVEAKPTVISLTPPGSLAERHVIDEAGKDVLAQPIASRQGMFHMVKQYGHWTLQVAQPSEDLAPALSAAAKRQKLIVRSSNETTPQRMFISDDASTYQVTWQSLNKRGSEIRVTDPAGKLLSAQQEQEVLDRIREGLKGRSQATWFEKLLG